MPARKRTTKRTVKKTRRAPTKRRTIKKKKPAKKGTARKRTGKAFGGYTITFQGCEHSLQDVFGKKPLAPSEMTKKLWAYVKRNRLNG